MKQFFIKVILLSVSLLYYSCEATDPSIQLHKIEITQQDVSVTEIYIRIRVDSPLIDGKIILFKNGNVNKIISPIAADTVVTDTAVTESTQYEYKAQIVRNDFMLTESETISIQTLKPTSHEVSWNLYEFESPVGTGRFNDIKIINENDIWIAGKIFDADSDGVYRHPATNAIHWDGVNWESKTIHFEYFYGLGRPETTAILGFNSKDVILASEYSVMHYNGTNWLPLKLLANSDGPIGSAYYLWGTSSEKFFAGGNEGMLVHWDGINWSKINLGTTGFIVDIFGTQKNYLGESSLYIAALSETEYSYQNELFKFDNKGQIKRINFNQEEFILTVWTNSGYPIYTGGGGMFSNKYGAWKIIDGTELIYIKKIRGNGINDIFAVGNRIMHFNGLEWHTYNDFNSNFFSLKSIDLRDNVIAICGSFGTTPIVIIGKRI